MVFSRFWEPSTRQKVPLPRTGFLFPVVFRGWFSCRFFLSHFFFSVFLFSFLSFLFLSPFFFFLFFPFSVSFSKIPKYKKCSGFKIVSQILKYTSAFKKMFVCSKNYSQSFKNVRLSEKCSHNQNNVCNFRNVQYFFKNVRILKKSPCLQKNIQFLKHIMYIFSKC